MLLASEPLMTRTTTVPTATSDTGNGMPAIAFGSGICWASLTSGRATSMTLTRIRRRSFARDMITGDSSGCGGRAGGVESFVPHRLQKSASASFVVPHEQSPAAIDTGAGSSSSV